MRVLYVDPNWGRDDCLSRLVWGVVGASFRQVTTSGDPPADSNDYSAPETERWLCHPPLSDVWELECYFSILSLGLWPA